MSSISDTDKGVKNVQDAMISVTQMESKIDKLSKALDIALLLDLVRKLEAKMVETVKVNAQI